MLENFYSVTKALQPMATVIISMMAVLGFLNARWLWRQTNRPIVSALIETHSAGNVGVLFNIVVLNTGNRPAIDIKLTIDDHEEFNQCIKNQDHQLAESISRCFDSETIIPLLVNGEKVFNEFGSTSIKPEQNLWQYGSSFSITINYKDLERNKYKSKLTLYIKDSKAFAGSYWED